MKPNLPQIPESSGPSAHASVQPEIADTSHGNIRPTRGHSRRPSGTRPKAVEIDHPYHLKEGDLDPATGYKIGHLIGAYETCIIYLDEAGDLHYWCTQKHEWPDEAAFAAIEVEGFHLRAATGPHVSAHDRYQINCMTAQAIALALESHDFAGARTALARARELLGQSQRIRIVLVTLGLVTFGVIVTIAVYLWGSEIQQDFGPSLFEGLLCAAAGGIGAALSVMQRTGQLPLPVTARPMADVVECIARFTIGTFAGVLLYLAISANLLLGVVNKFDNAQNGRIALLLALTLSAGVSERAFPKLVRSFEKQMH